MRPSRSLLLSLVLLSLIPGATAFAQTPKPPDGAEQRPAPAKNWLKIPVWVEDEQGAFWTEGKRQAFKVFLDEKETNVKSFQSPRSPTILLIVFDTVADIARVEEARAALQDVIGDLSDQYWVGLLSAPNGLTVLQEPTQDRALLREKIASIQVSGKAGLLDTVEPAARLGTSILRKAGVRLAVLYITDAGIANYRADYLNPVINSSDRGDLSRRFSDRAVQERITRLSESLEAYTVPLFVLHVAHREDTLNLAYEGGLERIAALSGGTSFFCRTPDEIRPALNTLMSRIRAAYFLSVERPATKRRTLRVRVAVDNTSSQPYGKVKHLDQVSLK